MPLIDPLNMDPAVDGRQSDLAMQVRTGIIRGLEESGMVFVPELALSNGRRADLACLDNKGQISIIEIKSSIADFQTDQKWPEYRDFCDRFYFATHQDVPREIFPWHEGFILADQYGCEIIREACHTPLAAATRKAMTLRIARTAASRLQRFTLHEHVHVKS